MVKAASIALIALGIIHFVVLGVDLPSESPRWLRFNLWTFEHWQPLRAQPTDLALSGGIFWATVGSFAVPAMLLAGLILWLDRRGIAVPSFVGWGLFAWALVASLIMAPSGFPAAALIALLLAIGLQRKARA